MSIPVILDVDTGIDDALAIVYALKSKELDVQGITTTYGNVAAEEATRNTLAVIEMLEKKVPVYVGADQPITGQFQYGFAKDVHGEDGLGNTLDFAPQGQPEERSAINYIIDEVRKKPNEITLITAGPLTNLALAIQKAPDIVPLIPRVVVMGGAVYVPGNKTPFAEANVVVDPEAADLVFSSGLPITLAGLDVTMKTLLERQEVEKWRKTGIDWMNYLADMTDYYMDQYEQLYPGINGCALHDPLAVGVAMHPDLIKMKQLRVKVVTDGVETGRTIGYVDGEPKISVCVEVDKNRFLQHFLRKIK